MVLPENHTDKVQPKEAWFGKRTKAKIGEVMGKWLEEDENLDVSHHGLNAKQRRILMTQWTGEAWKRALLRQDVC